MIIMIAEENENLADDHYQQTDLNMRLLIPCVTLLLACITRGYTQVQNQNITISTVVRPPWVIKKDNGQLEGIVIDLIKEVATQLQWGNYRVKLTSDSQHGSLKIDDSTWNGVIGDVINGDAVIGAGDLVVTPERQAVVDFTKPFYTDHLTMVTKTRKAKDNFGGIKLILTPIDLGNWIMLLVVCIVMGVLYGAINHFSPSEWSKVPPDEDKTNSRDSFSGKNAGFFVHSTLNWQGYKEVPRSPGGRFLTTMWFSFVSFLIYGYSANLVSILMSRPPSNPIIPHKSFRSMIQDVEVDVRTTWSTRDIESHFMNSADRDLPILYERVSRGFSSSDSVEKDDMNIFNSLSQSKNPMVLVTPSSVAKHSISNKCDLISTDSFLKLQYSFCAKKGNTDIINQMNLVLLKVIEDGSMQEITRKWMRDDSCERDLAKILVEAQVPISTARPLSIADLAVAYIMLLVGVVIGTIMLIVETCVHKRRQRQNKESNQDPVVMTTTNGGASKTEGGTEDEKVPMAADEP